MIDKYLANKITPVHLILDLIDILIEFRAKI